MRYRPVVAADIAALSTQLPLLLGNEWSQAALQALLAGMHQLRVLQQSGDKGLLGFAEFLTVAGECQLYNLAILPPWQRRGLGRHLLRCVMDEARSAGCLQCVLEVRESNVAARGLYQAMGFAVNGARKDYYRPLPGTTLRETAMLYSCLL